jgi:hypothetical protein
MFVEAVGYTQKDLLRMFHKFETSLRYVSLDCLLLVLRIDSCRLYLQ